MRGQVGMLIVSRHLWAHYRTLKHGFISEYRFSAGARHDRLMQSKHVENREISSHYADLALSQVTVVLFPSFPASPKRFPKLWG